MEMSCAAPVKGLILDGMRPMPPFNRTFSHAVRSASAAFALSMFPRRRYNRSRCTASAIVTITGLKSKAAGLLRPSRSIPSSIDVGSAPKPPLPSVAPTKLIGFRSARSPPNMENPVTTASALRYASGKAFQADSAHFSAISGSPSSA